MDGNGSGDGGGSEGGGMTEGVDLSDIPEDAPDYNYRSGEDFHGAGVEGPDASDFHSAPDVDLSEDYLFGGPAPHGALGIAGGYPIQSYAPPVTDAARSNQAERDAYWEARKEANEGNWPWEFTTDPDNLMDLFNAFVTLAKPMGVNALGALFSGKLTTSLGDIPEDYSQEGHTGHLLSNTEMEAIARRQRAAPTKEEKSAATSAASASQPKRAATGTPKVGIMANVQTTPSGLLGDAPVTRKTLLGS